jgi:hypothetical protein
MVIRMIRHTTQGAKPMTDTLPLLDLGTISHGTLRPQDLASALLDFSEYFSAELVAELSAITEDEGRDEDVNSDVIGDAIDALGEYAPPYCYVGFHEGDASDLGVWFSHDAFEYACHTGEILKIDDLAELDSMRPADLTAGYIARVSDHGNVTLYRPTIATQEVFAIV